jgi:hypothetical protein
MSATSSFSTGSSTSVRLTSPRSEALRLLRVHLERGRTLRQVVPTSLEHVEELRAKKDEWVSDTCSLLRGIFDSGAISEGFAEAGAKFAVYPGEMPAAGETFADELDLRLARLTIVVKRVEAITDMPAAPKPLADAAAIVTPATYAAPTQTATRPGVVIFAHVSEDRVAPVREFLGQLGLQVSSGSVGDPGEKYDFALLILGGEDADKARPGSPNPIRAEVAFDLGYLCGRVGPTRIATLFLPGGEGFNCGRNIPHIPLDGASGWLLHLARQIRRAGVNIDLNKVL